MEVVGGRQLREDDPIKKLTTTDKTHGVAIVTKHTAQLLLCCSQDHRHSAAVCSSTPVAIG